MQPGHKRNQQTKTQVLWRIAETNDTDAVAAVLATGVDVNARNDYGMTALMRAAAHGRVRMVRSLLEHGADPNLSRNDQFTALLLAAFFGHQDIVKTLIAHGADRTAVSRFATSAEMWASARTFEGVVDFLTKQEVVVENDTKPEIKTQSYPWSLGESFSLHSSSLLRLPSRNASVVAFMSLVVVVVLGVITDSVIRPEQAKNVIPSPMPQKTIQSTALIVPSKVTPPVSQSPIPTQVSASKSDNGKNLGGAINLKAVTSRAATERRPAAPPIASVTTNEPTAIAPAVATPTPKPIAIVAREPLLPKVPVPQTSQLIMSSKNSTSTGKVIKWP